MVSFPNQKDTEQQHQQSNIKMQSFMSNIENTPSNTVQKRETQKIPQSSSTTATTKQQTQQQKSEKKQKARAAPELSNIQSKYQKVFRGQMRPDPSIQNHPAFPTLLSYATDGCPVQCGEQWTKEHLEEAIRRGPHLSATSPEAAAFLHEEAREKVNLGQARIIQWDEVKDNPHPNLKISPVAAIEHKSWLYQSILDLSYKLRLRGVKLPSVNETTIPMSDHKAMEQMGQALWRLVTTIRKMNQFDFFMCFFVEECRCFW